VIRWLEMSTSFMPCIYCLEYSPVMCVDREMRERV
jgi:hypothetical protein